MFEKNTVRNGFEKTRTIPAELCWDNTEEKYFPIKELENNIDIERMAYNVNNRFSVYYMAKLEDYDLLKKALELIEDADYFGTSVKKFVDWQERAVEFRNECLDVLEGEISHEMNVTLNYETHVVEWGEE